MRYIKTYSLNFFNAVLTFQQTVTKNIFQDRASQQPTYITSMYVHWKLGAYTDMDVHTIIIAGREVRGNVIVHITMETTHSAIKFHR